MDQKKLKIIEYTFFILLSSALGIALSTIPGKQAHTDVLWYMNMSINNITDPHWMNRYTHVYLQKIFLAFTESSFQGLINYWAFIIAATIFLIFLNSRLLSKNNNFIHSGLSVLVFLSFSMHSQFAGVALADYTVMLIVMLIFLIYQLSAINGHQKPYLVIILGLFLFFAYRTKETAWIAGIVVIGLAFDQNDKFSLTLIKKTLPQLIYGIFFGVLVFSLLNGIFLKDFAFGFRIENFSEYYNIWIGDPTNIPKDKNWVANGIFATGAIPFLLYLASGFRNKKKSIRYFLIWSFPFISIVALSLGIIKSSTSVFPRFLLPSYAIVSLFAPLSVSFKVPETKNKFMKFIGAVITGLLLIYLIDRLTHSFSQISGISEVFIQKNITSIIYVSLLFLVLAFFKEYNYLTAAIPIVLLIASFQQDLLFNFLSVRIKTPQTRFYPLEIYQDHIVIQENMYILISATFGEQDKYFDTNIDTVRTIFDIHFKAYTHRDNYLIREPVSALIESTDFSYIFLTPSEWIDTPQNVQSTLQEECTVHQKPTIDLVFLDCYP